MKLLAPIVLLGVLLAAILISDDTTRDADLVFVNQNEVFTLDPQRMSYIQDLRLASALYEGLVRWNNADFSIVPAAAESYEIADDGLTYTFRLRTDAKWSNGDAVTSDDFAWSWRRAMLPETSADYTTLFFVIDGARRFFDNRQRRLRSFRVDPWSDGPDAAPEAVDGCIDRLTFLLESSDLPDGIAPPANRAEVTLELSRLADLDDDEDRRFELQQSAAMREWWNDLDESDSRAVEAEWLWSLTDRDFDDLVAIQTPDAHTLVVKLGQPTAYFLDLLCFGVFCPVHRPTVEGWPTGWPRESEPPPFENRQWMNLDLRTARIEQRHDWARPEWHVGNGPYELVEWRYKRDLLLLRSPTYHDQEMIRNDSVLALTIEDTNTAVLAFESGRVDWLADVSTDYEADMLEELYDYASIHGVDLREMEQTAPELIDGVLAALPEPQRGERRNIRKFPTFGTEFFSFNCREKVGGTVDNPFRLPGVRRAFAMAIDKTVIVDHVTRLGEKITTTLIPPGSIPGYTGPEGLPYDVDRAREELRDLGWLDRDGDGLIEDANRRPFPVIDLLYTTNIPRYKWICLNIKAQWEAALGVRIELRPAETKFYKEDLKQGKFMIARGRWYGDYGDPTTFLDLCRKDDGNNDRGYDNPKVDSWLDSAAREHDPAARMRILEECEAFLMNEEMPMMPLYQLQQVYMYEPGRVRGLSSHARLTQYLFQMEVSDG